MLTTSKQKPTCLFNNREIPVGVAEAEHQLGLLYQQGIGVMKNEKTAMYWYELAIEHGNGYAANNLGLMYLDGIGAEKNISKAENLLLLAYKRGDPNAAGNITALYIRKMDLDRALLWHERSLESGGSLYPKTADQEIRMRINKLKEAKAKLDKFPEGKTKFENFQKYLENERIWFNEYKSRDYNRDKLVECASKGSKTAKRLVDAMDHFHKALYLLFSVENYNVVELLKDLSYAYRTEHFICQMPEEKIEKVKYFLETLMSKNQDLKNEIGYHARICYAYLHAADPSFVVNFLTASLELYPNDCDMLVLRSSMFGILGNFEEALQDSHAALELRPDDYDRLYYAAVALLLTTDFKLAINFYEMFIKESPIDHPKLPEAYYAVAVCYMYHKGIQEMQDFYKKGLESEKYQLFSFMPYESDMKKLLETIMNISSDLTVKENILNDFQRIESIKFHRDGIRMLRDRKSMLFYKTTFQPNKTQKMPNSIVGLKEIVFKDMDFTKDHIMNGYVLTVTNIDVPIIGFSPSVHFVVEDKYKYVQKLCIYNLGDDFQSIKERFPIGCVFSIIDPYVRLSKDERTMIRVDDPNTVLMSDFIKENMCRYCGEEDSKYSCAKCKIAKYCSKECQTNDWKILNHKNVCYN